MSCLVGFRSVGRPREFPVGVRAARWRPDGLDRTNGKRGRPFRSRHVRSVVASRSRRRPSAMRRKENSYQLARIAAFRWERRVVSCVKRWRTWPTSDCTSYWRSGASPVAARSFVALRGFTWWSLDREAGTSVAGPPIVVGLRGVVVENGLAGPNRGRSRHREKNGRRDRIGLSLSLSFTTTTTGESATFAEQLSRLHGKSTYARFGHGPG